MLRIEEVRIDACENGSSLSGYISRIIEVPREEIKEIIVLRENLDARKGRGVFKVYHLAVALYDEELEGKVVSRGKARFFGGMNNAWTVPPMRVKAPDKPVGVIGAGPAGLFSAYILAYYGFRVCLFERGKAVEGRVRDLSRFWREGKLDVNSNLQFGEGGAGAFSDGKLTTRIKAPEGRFVLDTLAKHGGGEKILVSGKPHVGTNRLMKVLRSFRNTLLDMGVTIFFETVVTDFLFDEEGLRMLMLNGNEPVDVCAAVLAPGHSSRDTFRVLEARGVPMEAKPFAVGVRVEHPQELIDSIQYGSYAGCGCLPPADYRMAVTTSGGKGVYTFCMCPGGMVVLASSEGGDLPVNGMSPSGRGTGFANSGVVVQVGPQDFGGEILSGLDFQQRIEGDIFSLAGGAYVLPSSSLEYFLSGRGANKLSEGSALGAARVPLDLRRVFPEQVTTDLAEGLEKMGRIMKGFICREANIYGVESRTSSPLRILRGKNRESLTLNGLYPTGEGAGYSGGIVSSAVDGIRTAIAIAEKHPH